jgi:hypothetical protein
MSFQGGAGSSGGPHSRSRPARGKHAGDAAGLGATVAQAEGAVAGAVVGAGVLFRGLSCRGSRFGVLRF